MEGAHEVGEIAEADVVGDVGDGASSSASRRAAWRSRERTRYWCGVTPSTRGEQPQEMERADTGLAGGVVRGRSAGANWRRSTARFRPRGGGRARVGVAGLRGRPRPPRQSGWRTAGRPRRGRSRCGHRRRLRQFAQHHQFGQRRRGADLPDLGAVADRLDQFRRQGRTTGIRRRRHDRACRHIRRRDGRPGSSPPPVRRTGPRQWQPKLPLRT